jgi:hypothetical protein
MMRNSAMVRLVALAAVLALAVPVMAKPVTKSMTLNQPAKVGSAQLTSGEYRLLIEDTKVTIKRDKETLATVEGRWEMRDAKSRYNSVLVGTNGEIREVRFAGDRRVLVLGS